MPQLLVPGGGQNGVVHGGTQLDRADADGRDKGHGEVGVIGDAQVDEYGKLDHRHQDHRQRGRAQRQKDNEKHEANGHPGHHGEVLVGDLDEVLGAGRLAD